MPVKKLDKDLLQRRNTRALLFGPPNSWKTTSLVATTEYPTHIISPPGEEGFGTIPLNVPGLHGYVWEELPGDPTSAEAMRRDVEETVWQTIAGKNGSVRTLCIDGFHQLYPVYLNIATASAYGRGEDFEAQRYARAHQMAMQFLRRVLASPVEYVIVTTWNAKELDTPQGKTGHEYPDLPGRMAKLIVGCFSVVAFSKVTMPRTPSEKPSGEWVIKPDHDIWGAAIKTDPRLIAKLPARVPQNWRNLYKLLGTAMQQVEEEDKQSEVSVA